MSKPISLFEENESSVRSYCRKYPVVFEKAKGSYIYDGEGNGYLDFLAGCGALNYGHNNDEIKGAVIDYLAGDNISHAMDMYTEAKAEFIETFRTQILDKRNLKYKIMFCGSTGTNAVEAALKLCRKNKKRSNIIAFMGAFHGMTLGSLALTTDRTSRDGAGVSLDNVTFIPYESGLHTKIDSIDYLENILLDDHSGIEKPAAVVVETVQAEGGIYVASVEWLKRLEKLCRDNDILLVVDDIQVGCSRTGTFFSFERAGIKPDMVTLSKSIGGYGFPMSLLLIRDELDIWKPAEHNGTFRGNQVAFVAAKKAIEYNVNHDLNADVRRKGGIVKDFFEKNLLPLNSKINLRGIGLIWGVDFGALENGGEIAHKIADKCFEKKMIIERAGRGDSVVKLLPPLTITDEELLKGLNIILEATKEVLK
ncbi:MAG: diaminobutyrate--2-oxoglutarate transaminase [Lachnospiraceae bacterium]|nr:diaminobutyrate--2-oxoglutarate transaminase [Lachnospiraceae bacterium]